MLLKKIKKSPESLMEVSQGLHQLQQSQMWSQVVSSKFMEVACKNKFQGKITMVAWWSQETAAVGIRFNRILRNRIGRRLRKFGVI